jgi:prepilin-type N-terminal cleavage/methylation domain-containing protein
MKKAFSLFELSITLVIISLLIAGTIQGSRLLSKSRLSSAQVLTENSIVNNLDGLVAWFETSLDSSFGDIEKTNDTNIATWHDRSPNNSVKNNATQGTSNSQPKFYHKLFNKDSIPALRFDGIDDSLNFDGTSLANSDYTIFIVEQRRNGNNFKYFISTNSSGGINLIAGFRLTGVFTYTHSAAGLDFGIPNFDSAKIIPRIHTMMFDTSSGLRYWENGGTSPDDFNSASTTPISSIIAAAIGRSIPSGTFYNGDIAEVIIFRKSLTTIERKAVEDYLGKKYQITIS